MYEHPEVTDKREAWIEARREELIREALDGAHGTSILEYDACSLGARFPTRIARILTQPNRPEAETLLAVRAEWDNLVCCWARFQAERDYPRRSQIELEGADYEA